MVAHHLGTVPGLATPELAHEDAVALPTLGASTTHVLVTPTSERAADTPHVRGPMQDRKHAESFEYAGEDGKRLATLMAHLALGGFVLHGAEGGSFVVSRWGRSRPLADLEAVSTFLRQVGGQHG
jgi:hypothetical protein